MEISRESMVKHLRYKALRLHDVQRWNDICGKYFSLRWGNDTVRVRLVPPGAEVVEGPRWSILVGERGRGWLVCWLDSSFVRRYIETLIGEDVPMPEELRRVIVEMMGEDFLEGLSSLGIEVRRGGRDLSQGSGGEDEDFPYRVQMVMVSEERAAVVGRAELALEEQGQRALMESLKRLPREQASVVRAVPVMIHLIGGQTTLSVRELRSLEPLDIILLDRDDGMRGSRYLLWVSPRSVWWGERGEEGIVVVGREEEGEMAEESAQTQEMIQVRDVEVEIRFEVGRRWVTVGELEKINAGYVFVLDTSLDRSVGIYANRRLIGWGELVEVEERLGVRVVELENDVTAG